MNGMEYAIHLNALSAIYQDSTEKSKQTSQLLFGELCFIKSERDNFCYIENYLDKHCGWIQRKSLSKITETEINDLKHQDLVRVCMPLVDVFDLRNKTILRLPAGSVIPNYNSETNKFSFANLECQIHSSFVSYLPYGNIDRIAEIAMAFLNTPYIYGGKSVLGIDSAGFIQLIFSLCGYNIPRSLQDQSKMGVSADTSSQLNVGDIIFLENNNNIVDALLYIGNEKVINVDNTVLMSNFTEEDIRVRSCTIRRLV